jgi:hypothetical protein
VRGAFVWEASWALLFFGGAFVTAFALTLLIGRKVSVRLVSPAHH